MGTSSAERVLIRPVSYSSILGAENARQLMSEYAAECSIPEIGAISPQAEMYAAMEKSGLLKVFGVYQGDEVIGFAAMLVYVLPHYGLKIATPESLFVAKAHRFGEVGLNLIEAMETYAKEQGCAAILYSAPAGSRFEKLLSLSDQYRQTNSTFCRSLR